MILTAFIESPSYGPTGCMAVAAVATRGLSADVLRVVMAEHELITGEIVLTELRRVLKEKFGVPTQRIDDVEAVLRRYHVEPVPTVLPTIEIRDEDDLVILGSALAAKAEVLVTGDKDLLEVREPIPDIQISTPREFWSLLRMSGSRQ